MVLGITGGVGCGKSSVSHILVEKYNFKLLEADKIAHILMEPGTSAYNSIIQEFGTDILLEDGHIDRKKMGAIVFQQEEKRLFLNQLIHPAVKEYILAAIATQDSPHYVVEAALFLEAGYESFCDAVCYVTASDEARIKRLKTSRGYTEEKFYSMKASQLSHEEFLSRTDYVIDNSGSLEETILEVQKMVEFYNVLC